jgi:hypothetical protein
MIDHTVGVSDRETYPVKRIDATTSARRRKRSAKRRSFSQSFALVWVERSLLVVAKHVRR